MIQGHLLGSKTLRPYERATTDDKQSDKRWSSNLLLRSRGRPSRTGSGLATGQPTNCRFELSRRFPTEQAALKSVSGHPSLDPPGRAGHDGPCGGTRPQRVRHHFRRPHHPERGPPIPRPDPPSTDTSAGVSAAVHEGQWSAGEVPPLARRPTIMAVGREGVSVAAPKKYPNLFTAGRGSGLQP
jgi:hypothetical protein